MATNNYTDFRLTQDSYAAFDALSIKELIQNRLEDAGVYTGQSFEGSNMSSIVDVIAYSYHLLLFYLNQTSSETMFTDTNIYENMNRIVKLIDYKPKGYQTSLLSYSATATENLPINTYTIPRYSYLNANGVVYSFINDATFIKSKAEAETLIDFSEENLLREGIYKEYPIQNALGEDFEVVTLALKDPVTSEPLNIDLDSIDVFVRNVDTSAIEKYELTNNIFLESPGVKKYEKRLNENELYELKFGNGVFGNKLNPNDSIIIYYIESSGRPGKVSAKALDGEKLNLYNTPQFTLIKSFIYGPNFNLITPSETQFINFTNEIDSTNPIESEDVDSIRENAAKNFQLQNRLVTKQDFLNHLRINFSSILKSFSVADNNQYVKEYLKYFYDIGLNKPNDDSRLLFNQVNFSTINQVNNIYMFLVPEFRNVDENNNLSFLNSAQKTAIINSTEEKRLFNMNVVPMDAVYTAFTLGVLGNDDIVKEEYEKSQLVIKRDILSNLSENNLKEQVNNIFINYFNTAEVGQIISLDSLKNSILSLNGVKGIATRRTVGEVDYEVPNISLLAYNPIYPENDIKVITEDLQLPFFKFPYLQDKSILQNIVVENV